MAIVYVYNPERNIVEKYYRGLMEAMPYSYDNTLTVGEFSGGSNSNILWTDKRMMYAWNVFRRGWGRSIFIGYGFKRIWQGGHSSQSEHYAGIALDIGHTLSALERAELRAYANASGVWTYVEPASLTPRWIHVDKRFGIPACPAGGFPSLRLGSKGVYVFVLQDALAALGFLGAGLDGVYGTGTKGVVSNFQMNRGLNVTGEVDCPTWLAVSVLANGIGMTPTVIS